MLLRKRLSMAFSTICTFSCLVSLVSTNSPDGTIRTFWLLESFGSAE